MVQDWGRQEGARERRQEGTPAGEGARREERTLKSGKVLSESYL